MALQNIGAGNKDDAFYRYKMPKMITKIEGRGNGIKTNVVNMVDIAKALSRPASYTTKYFGCELGAQSKFDEKTGTCHVNGAHNTAKLAGLLENFIKKYVQCYGCGNPETEIIISKSLMITLKCAACGFMSDVDMRDKLTTFILKNPPEQKKGGKDKKAMRRAEKERLKEGETADEEQKKLKKDAVKKKGSTCASKEVPKGSSKKKNVSDEDHSPSGSQVDESETMAPEEGDDDDVLWQTDISADAARQRIQEQLSAVTASMVMLSTNEEKQKAGTNSSRHEEKGMVNGLVYGAKSSDSSNKLVDKIKEFLKKGSPVCQFNVFLRYLSGTSREIIIASFEALFEGVGKGFHKEVLKNKNYLEAALTEDRTQVDLLNAIESFCGKASPDAVKEVALVLKVLYDVDILEEEFIVDWYQKGMNGGNRGSPLWKNVAPFVEWLQNAESESEDE